MAGKEIYTGKMLESLESKIDEMVQTLQAHTVALGNINTAVAQGVSVLNIESGDTEQFITNIANVSFTDAVQVCKFKSKADGIVKFSFGVKAGSAYGAPNRKFGVYVSRNGAETLVFNSGDILTGSLVDYLNRTVSFMVGNNEEIAIRVGGLTSFPCIAGSLLYANAKLSYNKVDIVNDGAFIFL